MLVLSRKRGERTFVGENIVVTVLGVRGNQIKLGFECPETVQVQREEVCQRGRQERRSPSLSYGCKRKLIAEYVL